MEDIAKTKIEISSKGNMAVVSVTGELDISSCKLFREEFLSSGISDQKVIFDLRNISYMDSEGLKEIINCSREIRKNCGTMVLVCGDPSKRVIALTQMDKVFKICPSLEAATHYLNAS